MSMQQNLDLLIQKTACPEKVKAEVKLLSATYAQRININPQRDYTSGEFTALPYRTKGVNVVGTGLHRELQYPEICISHGANGRFTYRLNRLPPIYFRFFLGGSYPADPNFSFTLESVWLSSISIDLLSCRLTEEIRTFSGDFALKHCCKFIENQVIDYLFGTSADSPINIDLFEYAQLDEISDDAEGGDRIYRLTDLIVGHEEQLRNQEFANASHQCPICFDEPPGPQCIRFRKCGHVVCRNCAADHFATQIDQGANACQPTCVSCAETVRQQEVRICL
ncbi:unnamed protein product [Dibothriocephalus latus]|uniref:RING-type domain-containing protein n=1 Tax=Dibothriocephalus latus TaxID=60516 RepID=A0A3P7LU72_DIBLA|nr:unnamed protein product [Dibothriocephalus latus]